MKSIMIALVFAVSVTSFANPNHIFKPKLKPAYFDANEMSQCIAAQMISKFGKEGARAKIFKIQKLRHELFKKYSYQVQPRHDNWFDFALKIARPITGPFEYFHSLPFVDVDSFYEKTWGRGPLVWTIREAYTQAQSIFATDLIHDPGFSDFILSTAKVHPMNPKATYRDQVEGIENPLVEWLLAQNKPYSVDHPALLNKAIEIYDGDVLTALGVIGQLFYSDAASGWDRSRINFLGARLKAITVADGTFAIDPVGQNYHFWTYLNMALTGGNALMKAVSYSFESVYDGDMGEYSGDYWALKIGSQARHFVLTRTNPGLSHCH